MAAKQVVLHPVPQQKLQGGEKDDQTVIRILSQLKEKAIIQEYVNWMRASSRVGYTIQ